LATSVIRISRLTTLFVKHFQSTLAVFRGRAEMKVVKGMSEMTIRQTEKHLAITEVIFRHCFNFASFTVIEENASIHVQFEF